MACKFQFSATTGTIFNDTHLDLEKWFMAVALMVNAKKGLSALQMKRDLKVAYKTAWYLNHRIRKAMGLIELADDEPLTGTVEVDETYIGGKYDKRRKRAKYDKEPVFGMVERAGKARTYHVPQINRFHVIDKIKDNISIDTDLVCTDETKLYKRMPENVKKHEIVNHSAKEWVRGDVHTGTIDGYWGLAEARHHRIIPPGFDKAPAPLSERVSVPLEQPRSAGNIHAGDRGARDRVRHALQEADRATTRRRSQGA